MKKKILVIDDSALMRRVISDIINGESDFEVVKIARNGLEGYEAIVSDPKLYDIIVTDINMPKMDGLELLERLSKDGIRATIIVASTLAKEGAEETIRALELGAFDFVTKPETGILGRDTTFRDSLIEKLRMATIAKRPAALFPARRVETGNRPRQTSPVKPAAVGTAGFQPQLQLVRPQVSQKVIAGDTRVNKLVALACSTGGPKSLQSVIPNLPANLDAPVLLVQHMPKGFTASLASRLDSISAIGVKEAEDGDILHKGMVYVAPGGKHMLVEKVSSEYRICIDDSPPVDALKPCANKMYESLTGLSVSEITCVVLTGMGADGTRGITSLAKQKKVHVIAQDEETSVVYGMPRAIYEAGMVDEVCPLQKIADAITKNVGVS